jgi:hypothetical protein
MPELKKYRILFLGLVHDLETFKGRMSELGVRPETAEQIVHKAPVVLKAGMTLDHARRYAKAVQSAGAKVNIQQEADSDKPPVNRLFHIKPLEYFTMCTQCGHKQPRSERCVRCGHTLSSPVERNGRPYRS